MRIIVHLANNWCDYVAAKDGQGFALGEKVGGAFDVDAALTYGVPTLAPSGAFLCPKMSGRGFATKVGV